MPKPIITCKLCGELGPAADSHVIPRAFYESSKAGADHLVLVSNIPGERRKISRTGIYDRKLLCQACEALTQGYDDYGIEVLLRWDRRFYEPPLPDGGQTQAIYGVDPEKLQAFFGLLLWRILASDMPGFRAVEAPALQERLRLALLSGHVGRLASLEVLIIRIGLDPVAGMPDISNLMNGSVVKLEMLGSPTAGVGLGDLLVEINLGSESFRPPAGALAFPSSLDRMGGLLLVHDREYSSRHISILTRMVRQQGEKDRIEIIRRRVLKAHPDSFGQRSKRKRGKGSR